MFVSQDQIHLRIPQFSKVMVSSMLLPGVQLFSVQQQGLKWNVIWSPSLTKYQRINNVKEMQQCITPVTSAKYILKLPFRLHFV